MFKINIEIIRVDVKEFNNYFIVLQLDQLSFPSKLSKTETYRTEIESETEFPSFIKTFFSFKSIDISNRITIKTGLYTTLRGDGFNGSDIELIKTSKLIGSSSFVVTVETMKKIEKHKYIDISLRVFHPEKDLLETGYISLRVSLLPEDNTAEIFLSNQVIEECYYDPFENDKYIIKDKLIEAISLNEEKHLELRDKYSLLDETNHNLKRIAIDLHQTNIEFQKLEKENEILYNRLYYLQNIDEISIQIDLLSTSEQGIEILKKRYAVLCSQYALQMEISFDLECQYKEISQIMTKISLVKEKIESLRYSNKEVNFNIMREEDLMPLIHKYIHKTQSNDKVIKSLQSSIEELIKMNNGNIEETEKKLNSLYLERKLILEKTQQMNLHQEIYSGNDQEWEDNFVKVIGYDMMMNNMYNDRERYWIEQYTKRRNELEVIVKDLSSKVVNIQNENENTFKQTIVVDPNIRKRKIELVHKIEYAEAREKVLMNEIDTAIIFYKSSIAKLKDKIEEADKFIDKEIEFSKSNYYKTNQYGKY